MHADETRFISLADLLRAQASAPSERVREAEPPATIVEAALVSRATFTAASAANAAPAFSAVPQDHAQALPAAATVPAGPRELPVGEGAEGLAAIRAARLFHAALADMFDTCAAQLGRELAREVLSRELHTSPVDVAALARKLIVERRSQEPLRLRVAPADAEVTCELPVVADPSLQPGDAILECRGGEIDARLTIRLAAVVARLAP